MFQRLSSIFSSSDRSFSVLRLILLLVLTIGFVFPLTAIVSTMYSDEVALTRLTAIYLNKPVYKFDPVIGYRYLPNSTFRITTFHSGELVTDQEIDVNNKGFISEVDYFYKKSKDVYRIMVLGDSFTDVYYSDSSWVENLRRYINAHDVRKDGKKVEVYSFALAGSGIQNLTRIVSEELKKYEYDAIFITGLKISKLSFFTAHSLENYTKLGLIPIAPNINRQFDERIESQLVIRYEHKNVDHISLEEGGTEINSHSEIKGEFRFELLSKSRENLVRAIKLLIRPIKIKIKDSISNSKIEELMSMFQALEKDLLFVSIPNKKWVELEKSNIDILKRFSFYSKQSGIPFYDSYDDYFGSGRTVEELYFKHDDHWNQVGIDHYSSGLINFLNEEYFDKQ